MPLDPKAPNIVAETGTKKVRYRSTGRKGQITIVACGNATGQIMPPTIIYEAKNVNPACGLLERFQEPCMEAVIKVGSQQSSLNHG